MLAFRLVVFLRIFVFQKHSDALDGARHAKKSIDAVIEYVSNISQLLENLNLCGDTLVRSSDEFVAHEAAAVWGLPVNNMCYS